jgi:DNA-binding transcriptional regulator GbsR (MarR family)
MPAEQQARRVAVQDRLALTLEAAGFPRPMARVYAALMFAEGEGLATSELMDALGISKASVTNAMQLLTGVDLVQRYRVRGSREAHYRILKDRWGQIMARKFAGIAEVRRSAEDALAMAGSAAARERLEEMRDVYLFFETELSGVMRRWDERHKEER